MSRSASENSASISIPAGALYGEATARALSRPSGEGPPVPPELLWSMALIKRSFAEAHERQEILDTARAEWTVAAAQEVMDGRLNDDFPLSVDQIGDGALLDTTSNEVISNRAIEMMGGQVGSGDPVHPTLHIGLGQRPGVAVGCAVQITVAVAIEEELLPAIRRSKALTSDARTQARQALLAARDGLLGLGLHPADLETGALAVQEIADECRLDFVLSAGEPVDVRAALGAIVKLAGALGLDGVLPHTVTKAKTTDVALVAALMHDLPSLRAALR